VKRLNLPVAVGLGVLLAVLCILPFVLRTYHLTIATVLLMNIILVVSFRLITTSGNWSLAHIPLMGAGAYTAALLSRNFGWPFWALIPTGGFVAALVALAMSVPLVRTKGFAFFIASYAAGEAMRLMWARIERPFGGWQGIQRILFPELLEEPQ